MTGRKIVLSEDVEEEVEELVLLDEEDNEDEEASLEESEPVTIDDLSDDEKLWEDGPTVGDFKKWREEYVDVYITVISLPNNNVVWRPLEREEYRDHVKIISRTAEEFELDETDAQFLSEELIAEKCIIFPAYNRSEQKSGLAGLPTLIAQQVMEASGFSSLDVKKIA